jgi:copper homeostasis protein
MIRPRGGDFLYSAREFDIMKQDISIAKDLGADGVVLGILKRSGVVDVERTAALVELAKPLGVTFHRAFDMTVDPIVALEDIIEVGCERILTSGQKRKAVEGIDLLNELNKTAGNKISIMPGSGVSSSNVREIAIKTLVNEIHMSGHTVIESEMGYRREGLSMGSEGSDEFGIHSTSNDEIMKVKKIIANLD